MGPDRLFSWILEGDGQRHCEASLLSLKDHDDQRMFLRTGRKQMVSLLPYRWWRDRNQGSAASPILIPREGDLRKSLKLFPNIQRARMWFEVIHVDLKRGNCLARLSSVIRGWLRKWGELGSCEVLMLSAMTSFVDKHEEWAGVTAEVDWKICCQQCRVQLGAHHWSCTPGGRCEVNTNIILTTWLVRKDTPSSVCRWYKIFLYLFVLKTV